MKNPVQQHDAFERVALLLGLPSEALARNTQGTYINPQTQAGWKAWQAETVGDIPESALERSERILAVYREHGSCRENDEADHISFGNAVLDSFLESGAAAKQ